MTTNRKLLSAIIAFLPFVFFIFYLIYFVLTFIRIMRNNTHIDDPEIFFSALGGVFLSGALLFASVITALIYFIIDVMKNKTVQRTERIIWIIVLLFGSFLGFPIYWYLKIWKAPGAVMGDDII